MSADTAGTPSNHRHRHSFSIGMIRSFNPDPLRGSTPVLRRRLSATLAVAALALALGHSSKSALPRFGPVSLGEAHVTAGRSGQRLCLRLSYFGVGSTCGAWRDRDGISPAGSMWLILARRGHPPAAGGVVGHSVRSVRLITTAGALSTRLSNHAFVGVLPKGAVAEGIRLTLEDGTIVSRTVRHCIQQSATSHPRCS
jgi:hypothetical protein